MNRLGFSFSATADQDIIFFPKSDDILEIADIIKEDLSYALRIPEYEVNDVMQTIADILQSDISEEYKFEIEKIGKIIKGEFVVGIKN